MEGDPAPWRLVVASARFEISRFEMEIWRAPLRGLVIVWVGDYSASSRSCESQGLWFLLKISVAATSLATVHRTRSECQRAGHVVFSS